MNHQFFKTGYEHFSGYPILLILLAAAAAIIVLALVLKARLSKDEAPASDPAQEEMLENFEGLVRSLLTQKGEGMKQYEISSELGLPLEIVSERLNYMEKEGIIERTWDNTEYTYMVKAAG